MFVGVIVAAWVAGLLGAMVGSQIAEQPGRPAAQTVDVGHHLGTPRDRAVRSDRRGGVAEQVGSTVVAIQRVINDAGVTGESAGTGVIVTADGEIVTNAHVVDDAKTVNVRLPGETEPRVGAVIATDPANDLALCASTSTASTSPPSPMPADIHVGDQVVAIGYALDLDGDPSVTVGVVSALEPHAQHARRRAERV